MAVLVFSHTDPNHVSTSSVYWPACVCETTLASFGASRTPSYTDHSWWSTGSNNCNTINESLLYMISDQSFDNYLYLECHLN